MGPIFKGQTVQEVWLLDYGTDRLCRNVGNYQSTLRNIPEERRSYLHRSGSLKSRTATELLSTNGQLEMMHGEHDVK
jgi:hypothetical protein